ncbi:hypothetical protein ALC57_18374 [Trachymyrmex cornetzi]|uniref:Uncharacterized protein n=1 Tax=Trachymyrmex cornetzi TaxID=471704 RepID=A0A151IS40_9HYME|nr:hypothetical protein ALC57_18374 [Trachymyrmex cornetzi]
MKECDENETPSTPVSSRDFTSPNPTAENVSLSTNEDVTSQSSTETFAEDVISQNGSSNLDIQAQSLNTNTRNVSNSRKRKQSLVATIETNTSKRIRFMIGFQTKYMSRNDFISDEAWNKFLRYRLCQQSKMAAAHNRSCRKRKKIQNLQILIKDLEKIEEFNAAEYLKVSL